MKPVGVLIALLVIVAVVFVLWEDERSSVATRDDAGEKPSNPKAPTLIGAERDPPGQAPADSPGAATSARSEGAATIVSHFVEGRIIGLSAEEAASTHVQVRRLGDHDWVGDRVAEGSADENGHFRFDVGQVRAADPDFRRVHVSVDHAGHVVATRAVVLAPLASRRTLLGAPFVLERAFRVPVVVQDPDGEPICSASVVLVAMRAGEPCKVDGEALVLDGGSTDESGAWPLRAADSGPVLLLAGADGYLSKGIVLSLYERMPSPGPIVLQPGVSLSGHVSVNGAPAPAASLCAFPAAVGEDLGIWDISALWRDGGIAPGQVRTRTDERGRFELRGLPPGVCRVQLTGYGSYRVWNGQPEGEAEGLTGGDSRTETAPAAGVAFDVRAPVFLVRVVSDGEPVVAVQVNIGTDRLGRVGSVTDQNGYARFLVRHGQAFELAAHPERHAARTVEVGALGKSETRTHVLELGPRRPEGTLLVVVKDEAGQPIARAGFLLVERQDPALFFDSGLPAHHEGEGVFRLEGLPLGEHILIVLPNRSPSEWHGQYLNARVPVHVRSDHPAFVEVTGQRGTRVFVTLRAEGGALLENSAQLLDARDRPMQVCFCWSDDDSETMSTGEVGPGRTTIDPPLAPGSYLLVISGQGHEEARVPFAVDREPTKDLVVTLRKQ